MTTKELMVAMLAILKEWPGEYGLRANSVCIEVGGSP